MPTESAWHGVKTCSANGGSQKEVFEKGLVLVFTGHGKGKTTASLGLALRTLGHGHQVAVVQFIKGGWEPGEAKALKAFGDALSWHALGEGFTWETQDRERDRQLVQAAWETSLSYLRDPEAKTCRAGRSELWR